MLDGLVLLYFFVRAQFKSQQALTAEILALRQQVTVYQRTIRRPKLSRFDRLFWVIFSRATPRWRG